jgi:hypothetical protein
MSRACYHLTVLLVVASVALATTSCSRGPRHQPVFHVAGQVLFNGKPVPYAFVVLHPVTASSTEKVSPRAQADATGTFAISSYGNADGAPSGEYSVTVQKFRPPMDGDTRPPANLLPPRYADPTTSGLVVQVHDGDNTLEPLQLKR